MLVFYYPSLYAPLFFAEVHANFKQFSCIGGKGQGILFVINLLQGFFGCSVQLAYIFMRLYARANDAATVQLITVAGVASIASGIVITLFQYRKHVKRCKELLDQFEEQ